MWGELKGFGFKPHPVAHALGKTQEVQEHAPCGIGLPTCSALRGGAIDLAKSDRCKFGAAD